MFEEVSEPCGLFINKAIHLIRYFLFVTRDVTSSNHYLRVNNTE